MNSKDSFADMMQRNYTNAYTGTRYRLVLLDDHEWRITQSRTDHEGRVHLAHVRGWSVAPAQDPESSGGEVGPENIIVGTEFSRRFPRRGDRYVANPDEIFGELVMLDMDRTYLHLCGLVRRAKRRLDEGAPGFRPQAPILRQERDQAVKNTLERTMQMALWWRDSGLAAEKVPAWVGEALKDESGRWMGAVTSA